MQLYGLRLQIEAFPGALSRRVGFCVCDKNGGPEVFLSWGCGGSRVRGSGNRRVGTPLFEAGEKRGFEFDTSS